MNQIFRDLDVDALIANLKKGDNRIKSKHNDLIELDYEKIESTIKSIACEHDAWRMTNLRGSNRAKSFEELKAKNVPSLANNVRSIVQGAVESKSTLLKGISCNQI